jgi:hypothetical protein
MTCSEFQRDLPDFMEEGGTPELQDHLKGCTDCSGLLTSLQSIVNEAQYLQATEEPSPRVWNSIEIILRQEKLIRDPQPSRSHSILPSFRQRWGIAAWLVPAAAALIVATGVVIHQEWPKGRLASKERTAVGTVGTGANFGGDVSDQQLLQEVSARAPSMRMAYENNLKYVNDYIRDAQNSVNANPNDEDAQQALMDAYGQKSMIYEMALDRSLP